MATSLRIAVDAMGGDFGPSVTVAALATSLRQHAHASALLFGDRQQLLTELSLCADDSLLARIEVRHCDAAVSDEDKPSDSVRFKRNSSMGQAVKAVADGQAQVCISAGNTGALMALGLLYLKTLPGISRPAICTAIPTMRGRSYLLDLGANLNCSPQLLRQFALLGSLTVQELEAIPEPRVSLLNVGTEVSKGSDRIKQTAQLLEAEPLINYCGYIEGNNIFQGVAEVVVCDGFVGNVALKTTEGVAELIRGLFAELFNSNWLARAMTPFMGRAVQQLTSRLDPRVYNGAHLLGLNAMLVKSHGGADKKAFGYALGVAIEAAEHNLPEVLAPVLRSNLESNSTE